MNAPIHVEAHLASRHYRIGRPALLFVCEERGVPYASTDLLRPAGASEPENVSIWSEVHERIVALGAERALRERELCRWLRAAERLAVHVRTGHASLHEYAERILGLSRRQLEERLRVARALCELPLLDQSLASGELCWSAVRELSRVATPETEQSWLGWAKGRRSQQIEQAVAARRPGDGPRDRSDPSLVKHRLRFEVRPETMALFRDLQSRIRADLGEAADDDALLYEIARRALGGPAPGDEGRSSYQVAVTRCPECARASVDAGGQSFAVDDIVTEMVACDCQEFGEVHGKSGTGEHEGAAEQCPRVGADAAGERHGAERRAERGAESEAESEDSSHCPHVHVGVEDKGATQGPQLGAATAARSVRRARQSIPPAVRRQVLRRDRMRCVVDGCRNHLFLDVHHLTPVAEAGRHDPDRLCCLCGAHHRAAHQGTLVISGSATTGFTFLHADGTAYGQRIVPATLDIAEQAFGALRSLGFTHTQSRTLVDAVLRKGAPAELCAFVEAALQAT